jgi:hypothetical protein
MDKKKFDDLMDKWASQEMKAAPEISPAEKVYQRLKDRQKKSRFTFIPWPVRWAAAGLAAAVIILFIVLQPSKEIGPLVRLREGFRGEKGKGVDRAQVLNETEAPREEAAPRIAQTPRAAAKDTTKREKKSQVISERYVFQYQRPDTQVVEELDIRVPQDKTITLSPEDNYRLVLELAQETYVFVYQTDNGEQLIRLFPNPEYQAAQNPLQQGKTYFFPPPPNWFYVQGAGVDVTLYVIASDRPHPEWDDLYARYQGMDKKKRKKKILLQQTDSFTSVERMPGKEAKVFVFRFQIQ